MRTPSLSANLVMSDYLSPRAWRDGSADPGSVILITLIGHSCSFRGH
jgi:hypothetical protein